MDIPPHILSSIVKGECTLFLGAGASSLANAPSGDELSDFITNEYLSPGVDAKDWGLNLASAVSLAGAQGIDRGTIEKFVRTKLTQPTQSTKLTPSEAHMKIPWFRWRAIVTTNYDRLIETSYKNEARSVQVPVPVLSEEDLPEIGDTDSDIVPLLKPHGCISRKDSMSLSLEDIYHAKKDRRLLFTYIEILHLVGPVIYIGYSFKDVHILDMIYDLTNRLGPYRKPIVFVTLQNDTSRAEKERNWIQGPLKGIYLAGGFDRFMQALTEKITPAIGASMIVKQMAPCRTRTFVSGGSISDTTVYKPGWEYWLTYSINDPEGYAGVMFSKRGETDISKFGKVTFELNIPKEARKKYYLEAKLESVIGGSTLLLNIKEYRGKEWQAVVLPFGKQKLPGQIRRVVLADNGHRATLGREYKIGLREIKFE